MMRDFRFNLAVVAFALAFLLLAGKSEAAISYAGTCYPDNITALAGYQRTFPYMLNGANGLTIYALDPATPPTLTPAGMLTYTIYEHYPSLGSATGVLDPTMQLQLASCSVTSAPIISNTTAVIVCAAVVLAMMGFAAGKGYR